VGRLELRNHGRLLPAVAALSSGSGLSLYHLAARRFAARPDTRCNLCDTGAAIRCRRSRSRNCQRATMVGGHVVATRLVEILQSGERDDLYELCAWAIMPNHVHILILPNADPRKITHWLKGRSARESNLILGRTGPFWQHESYDHFVRNRKGFDRIRDYIEQNPVSAGFVSNPRDWPFSSASWTS